MAGCCSNGNAKAYITTPSLPKEEYVQPLKFSTIVTVILTSSETFSGWQWLRGDITYTTFIKDVALRNFSKEWRGWSEGSNEIAEIHDKDYQFTVARIAPENVVNNTEQSQDNNEQQQEVVNGWGQTDSQEREENSQNQTSQGAANWDSSVSAPDVAPAATPT